MPNIMGAINRQIPIANYSSIPNPLPDVFIFSHEGGIAKPSVT
jgi:hypothetical protein